MAGRYKKIRPAEDRETARPVVHADTGYGVRFVRQPIVAVLLSGEISQDRLGDRLEGIEDTDALDRHRLE
jgi:hypothetical protein